MRANIVWDESLVQETFKYAAGKTKRELVNQALQEFVEHHRRRDVRAIKGAIRIRPGYATRNFGLDNHNNVFSRYLRLD